MSKPLVAVCGLPNTGKTSLFNALTGSRAKVGNYAGVTVERRSATCHLTESTAVELLDVPGAYSLVARSRDEQIAVDAVLGIGENRRPDVVVACVEASNPMRGLYVALQLREFGANVVIAQTMIDEANSSSLDAEVLAGAIGFPVLAVDARRGKGLASLRAAISKALSTSASDPKLPWEPSTELRARMDSVLPALPSEWQTSEAMALWALMSVEDDDELEVSPALREAVRKHASEGAAIDEEIVCARYRWLDEHLKRPTNERNRRDLTDRLDSILIHRALGFVVFVVVMMVMFQALFAWCDPVIGWIELAFGHIGEGTRGLLPDHLLTDLLVDGVIAGVGSILVFIPQILLLFFFIGFLEDVGYMARVAVLMDRIMSKMNLNGRAFVPMLSGFACAVPAILATRTMERQRDRLLTMLVVPLMTCSARLPVYTLVIAALLPSASILGFPTQGLLLVSMYLFSVATALVAAWVMSRTLKPLKGKRLPLVVELPPYRLPRIRDVITMMWERTASFIREAGTVILACTVILWLLLTFPRADQLPADASPEIEREVSAQQLENSYAGRIGHAIEPAISPLGFDWKIGIGIVGAFAAREVFVSTMGVVYAVEADDDDTTALRERLQNEKRPDGARAYTPLVGLSLMIFFALACQCMSTLAVLKRETRGYRWPIFVFVYMTVLAWVMSFITYQVGRLLGF